MAEHIPVFPTAQEITALRKHNAELVAALARIEEQAAIQHIPAGDFTRRDGTRFTGGPFDRCTACHQDWPRELKLIGRECPVCIARAARDAAVGVGEKGTETNG